MMDALNWAVLGSVSACLAWAIVWAHYGCGKTENQLNMPNWAKADVLCTFEEDVADPEKSLFISSYNILTIKYARKLQHMTKGKAIKCSTCSL